MAGYGAALRWLRLTTMLDESLVSAPAVPAPRPSHIAHFVVRAFNYAETVEWYRVFFNAKTVFASDLVTFLTYDEEHHRVAILNLPGTEPHNDSAAGLDHVAFSFPTLGELILTYDRLKLAGIMPAVSINHGPTTSLYYRDPNGAQVEYQTDNISHSGGAAGFFQTDVFAANPVGVLFDADKLSAKYHAGEDPLELLKQGSAPVAA